jgi:FixJ family two-component response regulator
VDTAIIPDGDTGEASAGLAAADLGAEDSAAAVSAAAGECPEAAELPAAGNNTFNERPMNNGIIRVLYVTRSDERVSSIRDCLLKFEGAQFEIIWQQDAEDALSFLEEKNEVDVIVTEDVLSEMSGIDFTLKLKDLKYDIPIVYLTTSKDVSLAVEVMRLGVKDYLLKDDVVTHVFPQTLLRVVESGHLREEQKKLEIKQKRLESMQEVVVGISDKISEPLENMKKIVAELEQQEYPEKAGKYLKLIKENVERMQLKLEKLRNLKEDKTVKYIRDIKMIDLS